MKLWKRQGALWVVLATLVGCDVDESGMPTSVDPQNAVQEAAYNGNYDQRMAALGQRLPGFAGVFNDDGQYVVLMAVPASAAVVRPAVQAMLESRGRGPMARELAAARAARIVVRPAKYTFLQLHQWHQELARDLWSPLSLVFSDLDEVNNRVVLGVGDAAQIDGVRAAAVERGLPADAIHVELVTDFELLSYELDDNVPNEVGGVMVSVDNSLQGCTLGFNLDRSNDAFTYFVTAAHCTDEDDEVGIVDGYDAWQPQVAAGSSKIGVEVNDPAVFTGAPCPSMETCRNADVALFKYTGGSPLMGEVAAPIALGDRTYNGTWKIINEYSPDYGDAVTIVGRVSGQVNSNVDSVGVSSTCANITGTNDITYRCQFFTEVGDTVVDGDSGAPVVHWEAPMQSNKRIAMGMVIAKANFAGGTRAVFSGMTELLDELEADLGSGTLTSEVYVRPNPTAAIIGGPSTVPANYVCNWTGAGYGGVPGYTYTWWGAVSGSGASVLGTISYPGEWINFKVTDDIGHSSSTASLYVSVDSDMDPPAGCDIE